MFYFAFCKLIIDKALSCLVWKNKLLIWFGYFSATYLTLLATYFTLIATYLIFELFVLFSTGTFFSSFFRLWSCIRTLCRCLWSKKEVIQRAQVKIIFRFLEGLFTLDSLIFVFWCNKFSVFCSPCNISFNIIFLILDLSLISKVFY